MGIRVLHVLDKISVDSGVSTVVMNYYAKLNHERITFDFMVNEDIDTETRAYIEASGSKVFIMPELKVVNVFKYIRALKAFYKTHDYKIIHGHVANSAVFYLGLARKIIPIRIIHSHSTKTSDIFWKRIRNWALVRFIKYVANNRVACSEDAAVFLFGKKNDAALIENAICVGKFTFNTIARENTRCELGLEKNYVIGHIGRFSAVKNHDFLVDVFLEVHNQNDNARLLLIGDGELYQDTIKKVENLGLKESVTFLGLVDEVNRYINAMDILVLPSLFEGLGLVVVEAQASGLPVIVSEYVPRRIDITGSIEFLKLDKSLWAKALLSIPADSNREKQGKKVMGSRFDISIQIERLCEYYERLLESI